MSVKNKISNDSSKIMPSTKDTDVYLIYVGGLLFASAMFLMMLLDSEFTHKTLAWAGVTVCIFLFGFVILAWGRTSRYNVALCVEHNKNATNAVNAKYGVNVQDTIVTDYKSALNTPVRATDAEGNFRYLHLVLVNDSEIAALENGVEIKKLQTATHQ